MEHVWRRTILRRMAGGRGMCHRLALYHLHKITHNTIFKAQHSYYPPTAQGLAQQAQQLARQAQAVMEYLVQARGLSSSRQLPWYSVAV